MNVGGRYLAKFEPKYPLTAVDPSAVYKVEAVNSHQTLIHINLLNGIKHAELIDLPEAEVRRRLIGPTAEVTEWQTH